MDGGLRKDDVASDLGLIDDLTDAQAGGSHKPAEVDQRRNGRQRRKVALEVGTQVAVEPDCAIGIVCDVDCGIGKPATTNSVVPVFGVPRLRHCHVLPCRIRRGEEFVPTTGSAESLPFSPCHWPKRQVTGSSRQ